MYAGSTTHTHSLFTHIYMYLCVHFSLLLKHGRFAVSHVMRLIFDRMAYGALPHIVYAQTKILYVCTYINIIRDIPLLLYIRRLYIYILLAKWHGCCFHHRPGLAWPGLVKCLFIYFTKKFFLAMLCLLQCNFALRTFIYIQIESERARARDRVLLSLAI